MDVKTRSHPWSHGRRCLDLYKDSRRPDLFDSLGHGWWCSFLFGALLLYTILHYTTISRDDLLASQILPHPSCYLSVVDVRSLLVRARARCARALHWDVPVVVGACIFLARGRSRKSRRPTGRQGEVKQTSIQSSFVPDTAGKVNGESRSQCNKI